MELFDKFRMLFEGGLLSWEVHTARTAKQDIFGDVISEGETYCRSSGVWYQGGTVLSMRSLDALFKILFSGTSLIPEMLEKVATEKQG